MFVGEAPGFNEDKEGRPFVGAAGRFLDQLLELAGFHREEVYITNVVKCRPPRNRDPLEDEVRTCTSNYLHRQLRIIKPKLVVALGRIAAGELLGRPAVMAREHGRLRELDYGGSRLRLFITYHPAAALYGAEAKRKLVGDFRRLRRLLG
jgi:DNA polymerase